MDQELKANLDNYNNIQTENQKKNNIYANLEKLRCHIDEKAKENTNDDCITLIYYLIANLDDRLKKLESK